MNIHLYVYKNISFHLWRGRCSIGGDIELFSWFARVIGFASGLPALISFTFSGSNSLAYKTLLTQEMLSKGYLASTNLYVCTEHSREILDGYFNTLEPIFSLIQECENGSDINALLRGPVCHAGFKRLN